MECAGRRVTSAPVIPDGKTIRLPRQAAVAAVHVPTAAGQGIELLLTSSSTHIGNAELRQMIDEVSRNNGPTPAAPARAFLQCSSVNLLVAPRHTYMTRATCIV
jgi:hypothetical protein